MIKNQGMSFGETTFFGFDVPKMFTGQRLDW